MVPLQLVPETVPGVRTVGEFKKQFDLSITSVPVLGPVEANELLYEREAARLALLTYRASRNFRNILGRLRLSGLVSDADVHPPGA